MKIHMVVLYLYLLIFIVNGHAKKKSGGKLSKEENKERLRTCGTTAIGEWGLLEISGAAKPPLVAKYRF